MSSSPHPVVTAILVAALAALAALAAPTGCASVGTGKARTLRDGEQSVGVGLDLAVGAARFAPQETAPLPWVYLTGSYRRGIGGLDIGARIWGSGLPGFHVLGVGTDLKIPLIRREADERGWDIALDPGLAYHQISVGGTPTNFWMASFTTLFGYNTGVAYGDQLVLGPRVDYQFVDSPYQHPMHVVSLGGSLGYAWRPRRGLEIMPQLTVTYSPVSFNGTLGDRSTRGLTLLQLGFGGSYDF